MESQRRVLIIEDEASIRRLALDLLESEGYEVRAAGTGREGLAVLREWRPDVIVLDLMMPEMDGRTFRAEQGDDSSGIPLVILSASREAERVGAELGAVAIVPKPFDLDDLVAAVQDATGR